MNSWVALLVPGAVVKYHCTSFNCALLVQAPGLKSGRIINNISDPNVKRDKDQL